MSDIAGATELIVLGRGRRYDPTVVDAFHEVRTGRNIVEEVAEIVLPVAGLRAGMVLSRDLVTDEGVLSRCVTGHERAAAGCGTGHLERID